MEPNKIPIVIPNWYKKYSKTSNALGVRSVNLLIAVNINNSILKKNTNDLTIPLRFVNFKRTKVITVTEIARTVRNPVFIPNIKNNAAITSPGPLAETVDKSIFSGDAKRGTLKIAFIKKITNIETETVLT